ncbi:cytochrome c biogenesis CcdA family protein [Amphibiibacter pelophylacis]|uniref:Cytochrome c biogenesis protein CcdA n=1 Tax=Amphibiibacter pelophylacis TaxID=1799477 RepID=A0ACC6NZF3_9BURK
MLSLAILSFLAGVLTILSPCILPVLPFVFARSDRGFMRSTLPLLVGMGLTFVAFASVATVGGGWIVSLGTYGRWLALLAIALMAIALIAPGLSAFLTRPLVRWGNHLNNQGSSATVTGSVLIGVATGLLWAPCAGPILGLILTGAAIKGPNVESGLLLTLYALGAIASLSTVMLLAKSVGRKIFSRLGASLGLIEGLRKTLGILMLASVLLIATGLDSRLFNIVSSESVNHAEQKLVDYFHPGPPGGN